MMGPTPGWRRWAVFAIVSAFFFHITAATFTSFGVVLPFMIEHLAWTWSQAGTGFSLLALMVGLSGALPAWTLRRFGVRATYGAGGLVMASGFGLLATTAGLHQYFLGAGLLGMGYALCATVPAVHLLNQWFPDRRALAIGAYMTIGGLGAVAGPLIATRLVAVSDSWRVHWWAMGAVIVALGVVAMVLLRSAPEVAAAGANTEAGEADDRVFRTRADWRFRDVIRTPQYYVIVAALTMTLLSTLTMNSWAFTHMGMLGVSAAVAAGALSADGAVNALSRAVGGALASRIDPKWLLVAALAGEAIGMLALSVADNAFAIGVFALGEGFGFGMCFFATTMLLVNYFGPTDNPEILGTLNMITTVAMVGPVLGGFIADTFGGFTALFRTYAAALLLLLLLTAAMRPPQHRGTRAAR
jgi:MFS family permease